MLHLEMSFDIEITGYEEPTPSTERVDLTKEMKSRQRSLLEFASDSPGPTGTGQHQSHVDQCFCRDSTHVTVTKKVPAAGIFLYRTLPKMAAEFRKRTAKKFVLPPKFQKVRFEMNKKFMNIYGMYVQYSATSLAWPDLFLPSIVIC